MPGELSERSGAVSGLTHIDPWLVGSQLCESIVWRELADTLLCRFGKWWWVGENLYSQRKGLYGKKKLELWGQDLDT